MVMEKTAKETLIDVLKDEGYDVRKLTDTKLKFRNVSWPIKVAIIAAWVYAIEFVVMFGIGFLAGALGYW